MPAQLARALPILLTLTAAALAAPLGACASGLSGGVVYGMSGTNFALSADAEVRVAREGSLLVAELQADYLMPPQRVAAGLEAYVVWVVPDEGAPIKAANLDYDAADRSGSAFWSMGPVGFEVRVTAETSHVVQQPSEYVVLVRRVTLMSK
jgi:hypothetical protein